MFRTSAGRRLRKGDKDEDEGEESEEDEEDEEKAKVEKWWLSFKVAMMHWLIDGLIFEEEVAYYIV